MDEPLYEVTESELAAVFAAWEWETGDTFWETDELELSRRERGAFRAETFLELLHDVRQGRHDR